jgi:hypothetical protein
MKQVYLGLSGVASLDQSLSIKYNSLLAHIGTEEMLIQFERFIDDNELADLINQIEENIKLKKP